MSQQIQYNDANFDVTSPAPDVRVLVVHEGDRIHVFPMPTEFAEELGRKLSSPSVVLPTKAEKLKVSA